MGEVNNKRGKL